MERIFFIRRRRISLPVLGLCVAVTIFLVRTHFLGTNQHRHGLGTNVEQSKKAKGLEKINLQDERGFQENEPAEQESETDWVEPVDTTNYNQAGHEQPTDDVSNHGDESDEKINGESNDVDFMKENEEGNENKDEQLENVESDDLGAENLVTDALEEKQERENPTASQWSATQQHDKRKRLTMSTATNSIMTRHATNSDKEVTMTTRRSAVNAETSATPHVTTSGKETAVTTRGSTVTTETSVIPHVTKSDKETTVTTLEPAVTAETSATPYMTESDKKTTVTVLVPAVTTETSATPHVTESGKETAVTTRRSAVTSETSATPHVTESGKETTVTTRGSAVTSETSATPHVTRSSREATVTTSGSAVIILRKSNDSASGQELKENKTRTVSSSPFTISTRHGLKSYSELIKSATTQTTPDASTPYGTKLTTLLNQNATHSPSASEPAAEPVTLTPELSFTLATTNDDETSNGDDDDNEHENGHTKSQVFTPKPRYTIEPTVSASSNFKQACTLPKLDPWDTSIIHLLKDVGRNPGCRDRYPLPLFDVIKNRLVPKQGENVRDKVDFESIRVETFHRNEKDDYSFHHIEQGNPFVAGEKQNAAVGSYMNESDFFRIKYQMKEGDEIEHYFSRVVPLQSVIRETKKVRDKLAAAKGLPLNVLVIGIDSTAANNFYRKLHFTLQFLRSELNTYFFKGYSVIGDATTPALSALMTGKREDELPEGRQGYDGAQPVDNWPWVSKKFKAHGYATLFAEDDPRFGAFNLRLLGFREPPYDHYSRPFWLALEEAGERDGPGLCSKSISMVNYTIEYLKSYFDAYPNTPKFAFAFVGYLAHAHPNHLSYADYDLLHLLKFLVKNKYDQNTMLVLLGDHGSRNDDVRNTMQGKLEERLPWLSITLPKWVVEKYPDVGKAMMLNQDILCTPFDVHATLRHVLTYPTTPKGEKGRSLFTEVPADRTCKDAHIDDHWCPCLQFSTVNTSDPKVLEAAKEIVKSINKKTSINRLLMKSCVRLSLKSILSAVKFEPNEKVQTFSNTNQDGDRGVNFGERTPDNAHLQVTIQTSPGDGRFEATVTIDDEGNFLVNPNISRTNTYGNQPKCILRKYPYVRQYCLCKA